ncbi:MAG: 5'-nucleotidase [Armatimonadota bacterium]|nr:5'-nucleotidase C-terminal domain-containing protein [bacterium]
MKISRSLSIICSILLAMAVSAAGAATVQSKSALGNKDVAKMETAVGDLAADAIRAAAHADIAFVAASELKSTDTPIPAGKVSSDDIASLVSYSDDPLAVLELNASEVRQALERAVSITPQPNLGFLQVSGLQFKFDQSKKTGERVTSVTVDGTPLNEARTYLVAVTNSMANGALGYWKVWSADNIKSRLTDTSIVKAVDAYFTTSKGIDYGTLDRIGAK